jgi:hypothetical protein
VLFDYFFPGIMPGNAVEIPDEETVVTDANWVTTQAAIRAALDAEPAAAAELADVTGVPHDTGDPETLREATTEILRYSFMGTNDARDVLGGNPFGNGERVYSGSSDDGALNAGVSRHSADAAALATIESAFQTSGSPAVPLVVMHTTGDPVTPVWHPQLYVDRNAGADETVTLITVDRFGHCGFSPSELLAGFSQLVASVEAAPLVTTSSVFPDEVERREFDRLVQRIGSRPTVIDRP